MIKLLDLYSGGGGCAMGYYLAAQDLGIEIEITGVDIIMQKNYPFNFIQGDALEYLGPDCSGYTHIHASPPCQAYSRGTAPARSVGSKYPDLLGVTIEKIKALGVPAVVENVMTAPMPADLVLRGDMFGLKVLRARKFHLLNWFMMQPGLPAVRKGAVLHHGEYVSVFGNGQFKMTNATVPFKYSRDSVNETWSWAMGIDWMTTKQLAESVPPAYTRYIGNQWFR